MTWFKVDDTLALHPKVLDAGNKAMGLWVRAGAWSAQQLTDGFVPTQVVGMLGGTRADAQRLTDARLWVAEPGGWRFHEWSDRQPSRDKVVAERDAAAERKRLSRERAAAARAAASSQGSHTVTGGPSHGVTSASVTPTHVTPPPTRPDPTRPDQGSFGTLGDPPGGGSPPTPLPRRGLDITRPDIEALCTRLAERIEANGSRRPTITKAWRDACRLMLDRDGRTPEQVSAAIDWCQANDFWRSNVLSMPKLREKYDQMRLQATRQSAAAPGQRLSPGDRALALIHDLRQEDAR